MALLRHFFFHSDQKTDWDNELGFCVELGPHTLEGR